MQTRGILLLCLAFSVLGTGCVGTGPNTQQGAVTGGAIGALAGAIIGNNSGGHNALGGAIIGGAVGAIAGGTIGNSVDQQRGTIYGSEREATTTVVVQQPPPPPPPPPSEVVSVQPAPGAVWIPGYWAFDGYRYVWVSGGWQMPPPYHYAYVAPHWVYRGGRGYIFVRGYWR
jgi:hypothetical protein